MLTTKNYMVLVYSLTGVAYKNVTILTSISRLLPESNCLLNKGNYAKIL